MKLLFAAFLFAASLINPLTNANPSVENFRATLCATDDMCIRWGTISGLPTGSSYSLGVWPDSTGSCDLNASQIAGFPQTYTYQGETLKTEQWSNPPNGNYYAALYTNSGLLSDCLSFTVTTGGWAGSGCQGFLDCISDVAVPGLEPEFTEQGLVGKIISAFLPALLGIAGFVTVIIIIISGIQFVTSGGNPEAAAAARGRLTFAIIGFVIIVLAFAILQIVDKLFLGTGIA